MPPPRAAPPMPPAAGPAVQPAPRQEPRRPKPRAGRDALAARRAVRAPGRRRGRRAAADPRPPAPARRRRRRPAAAKPRGKNGEARGWVADLLRRASSSESRGCRQARRDRAPVRAGKRSPAQVVESLNSLSIDIARAIDHEASVELWDRYKRGERNVFTRRLYTLQGQKTFDELRRKYERDGDFRKAVDNYIGDFERLLVAGLEGRRRPDACRACI